MVLCNLLRDRSGGLHRRQLRRPRRGRRHRAPLAWHCQALRRVCAHAGAAERRRGVRPAARAAHGGRRQGAPPPPLERDQARRAPRERLPALRPRPRRRRPRASWRGGAERTARAVEAAAEIAAARRQTGLPSRSHSPVKLAPSTAPSELVHNVCVPSETPQHGGRGWVCAQARLAAWAPAPSRGAGGARPRRTLSCTQHSLIGLFYLPVREYNARRYSALTLKRGDVTMQSFGLAYR
mmetsp:Transcript_49132/g.158774  ORF Transcript_49132/g.158774 Transcript_49132/m.158774 type:complete len:238 (-) Transcript_49132:948-1661(-)